MATAEAHAIFFNKTRFMNQYLQEELSMDRMREAIKGKRREAAYQALVQSRLKLLEADEDKSMTDSGSSSFVSSWDTAEEDGVSPAPDDQGALRCRIKDLIETSATATQDSGIRPRRK